MSDFILHAILRSLVLMSLGAAIWPLLPQGGPMGKRRLLLVGMALLLVIPFLPKAFVTLAGRLGLAFRHGVGDLPSLLERIETSSHCPIRHGLRIDGSRRLRVAHQGISCRGEPLRHRLASGDLVGPGKFFRLGRTPLEMHFVA